jgi:hypothetical protein
MSRIAVALVVLLAFTGVARSASELTHEQRRETLIEAQRDYDRAIAQLRSDPVAAKSAFQSAADRFQLAADSGAENGVVRYNLANAYLQAGDLGRAILNFRRAERLIPGDARLRANLDYARTLVRSQIAASGSRSLMNALLAWHHRTSTQTRWVVFAAAYTALWVALVIRQRRSIAGLSMVVVIGAVLAAGLGLSVASDLKGWGRPSSGVILIDDVTVRKGNGLGFEPQFAQSLHSGTEFELIERRGDWMNVRFRDGKSGWIEAAATELVP